MTTPNETKAEENYPIWPVSDRSYPEDFPQENGYYSHKCPECSSYFEGHKHRVICKLCATQEPPPAAAQRPICDGCGEYSDQCRCKTAQRETPRTDEAVNETGINDFAHLNKQYVTADFAEVLERELAEARERLAELARILADPVAVYVNILRGKIAMPKALKEWEEKAPSFYAQAEEIEWLRGALELYRSTMENSRKAVSKGGSPYDLAFFDSIVGPAIEEALAQIPTTSKS